PHAGVFSFRAGRMVEGAGAARADRCGIALVAAFAAALAVIGCASPPENRIAPSPHRAWAVPNTAEYSTLAKATGEARAPTQGGGAPPVDPGKAHELAELIDIAERTNPDT